jgi:penicillin-insensitive murein endopeptidase
MFASLLVAVLFAQASPDAGVPVDAGSPGFDRRFATVKRAAPGPAESIGKPGAGCVKGAVALPKRGKDYVITRPERQRFYGHPVLIAYLRAVAKALAKDKLGPLFIGDLGQPIGGPTPTGHRSHQNGLDVDLWFAPPQRAKGPAPVLVNLKTKTLLPVWNKAVIARLRVLVTMGTLGGFPNPPATLRHPQGGPAPHATISMGTLGGFPNPPATLRHPQGGRAPHADLPEVDRIFVHPAIKRALCQQAPGPWLRVVRPWWGHHDHLHVRLRCPADSPACEDGAPLPEGDGCDKVDWWFTADATTTKKKKGPPGHDAPPMPPACLELVR